MNAQSSVTTATLPRLGDVVANRHTTRRGMVVWIKGEGHLPGYLPFAYDAGMVICHGAGTATITTRYSQWLPLPQSDWTAEERVRSAEITWAPPCLAAEESAREVDSLPFALLGALLTPAQFERVFPDQGDWPSSVTELAFLLARELERIGQPSERVMANA